MSQATFRFKPVPIITPIVDFCHDYYYCPFPAILNLFQALEAWVWLMQIDDTNPANGVALYMLKELFDQSIAGRYNTDFDF